MAVEEREPSPHIRLLEDGDLQPLAAAFSGWTKPMSLFQRYLAEQQQGNRVVLVAVQDGAFVGYLTIKWESDYPPFQQRATPELNDLNVLPEFRRKGIGTALMDEAEDRVIQRSTVVGLGVGMDPDYGAAQRMYVLRGYVPDGLGLVANNKHVRYGDKVTVNDDLCLYFLKPLR